MTMPLVFLTKEQLDETARLLESFAPPGDEHEGIVYWFGLELGESAVVTTLVVPDADATYGSVRTSPEANAEAVALTIGTPLVLLGQVHSHPSEWVEHSYVDDRDTFAQWNGALSVVVPWYGRQGIHIESCGVHRHFGGRYEWIPAERVGEHLQVLTSRVDLRKPRDSRSRSGFLDVFETPQKLARKRRNR